MNTAIAVMAAGASQRFGGCKLLADVDGKPLLEHSIRLAQSLAQSLALSADKSSLHIITGAWHPQLLEAQRAGQLSAVPLIRNPDWQQGLGNSIAFACAQLPPDTDRLLIMLADQIALRPEDLQQLLDAETTDIVCAHYLGRPGVPALFQQALFPALQALHQEPGARSLLRHSDYPRHEVLLPHAAIDIDTPDQLADFSSASNDATAPRDAPDIAKS